MARPFQRFHQPRFHACPCTRCYVSTPLTSIVIPNFMHAATLAEAVCSALSQTAPVEVLVVDDGSSDDSLAVAQGLVGAFANNTLRIFSRPRAGVAAARNFGLAQAVGEYVMFLDADDVLDINKVDRQVRELEGQPECGWCLCDTAIHEVRGTVELASDRYHYRHLNLGGWIFPQLTQ